MADNEKVLENGLAKGLQIIEDMIVNSLIASLQDMFSELPRKIGFTGFTGQTQTSYMGGIYINGSLRYIITEKEWTRNPVRGKIPKGKRVYLSNPYDGRPRARQGYVNFSNPSGRATSLSFLKSYHASKKGICVVVTTGTEYSKFLETQFNLDVLTRTFRDAPRILNSNWKKIED